MDARRMAWTLSLAGFLPFAALALVLVALGEGHPLKDTVGDAARTYGAVILSFLGGIRWGLALLRQPSAQRELAISVLPAIAGWLSLFAPAPVSFGVLLIGFLAQGAWDSFSIQSGAAPAWFGPIRITLTVLVAAAMALSLAATV